jgi:hypothetical protein
VKSKLNSAAPAAATQTPSVTATVIIRTIEAGG